MTMHHLGVLFSFLLYHFLLIKAQHDWSVLTEEMIAAYNVSVGACLTEYSGSADDGNLTASTVTLFNCATADGSRSAVARGMGEGPTLEGFRISQASDSWNLQANLNFNASECNLQIAAIACRKCRLCEADDGSLSGIATDKCDETALATVTGEAFANGTCVSTKMLMTAGLDTSAGILPCFSVASSVFMTVLTVWLSI